VRRRILDRTQSREASLATNSDQVLGIELLWPRSALRSKRILPKRATFPQYHKANFVDVASLLIHRPRGPNQLQIPLAALDQPEAKFDAWKRGSQKVSSFHQTGPGRRLTAGALLSTLHDRISNQGESVWPTTRLTELKDLAEKKRIPWQERRTKQSSVIFLMAPNTYPGTA
jgi:hypothetical protein